MFNAKSSVVLAKNAKTRIFSITGPFRICWINFSIDTSKADIEITVDDSSITIDLDAIIDEDLFQQNGFPIQIARSGVNCILYFRSPMSGDTEFSIDVTNKKNAAAEIGLFYIEFDSKEAPI